MEIAVRVNILLPIAVSWALVGFYSLNNYVEVKGESKEIKTLNNDCVLIWQYKKSKH